MNKTIYDLIDLIMIKYFKKGPDHITIPQREELKGLNIEQLEKLLTLGSIDEIQSKCEGIIPSQITERLLRRTQINQAINHAIDKGLYELAEHQTSSVDI